ncbi:MAG: outer membrane protein assembly factor BamC [Gammaproteobacteria bacterium]
MKSAVSPLVAGLLLPALGACSWLGAVPGADRLVGDEGMFRDRQGEYLEAETIPRTVIPEGLDGYVIDDLLVIPEIGNQEAQPFFDAPRPRPLEGASDREVVIQRMTDRAWIIVDASPAEVWPRIRDYWRQENIQIASENPTIGQMDTAWFERSSDVLNREKFRVIVETGFQDNSSEIRLVHVEAPRATPVFEQINWPERSEDFDVEYETLSDLSTYLADVADLNTASSVSFLAGNISSTGKAALFTTPAGTDVLSLQADYQRCWAAVGRALRRAGMEITSENADVGMYEVVYTTGGEDAEEEEEPGFFRKLVTLNGLFGSDEDESQALPFRVEVLEVNGGADVRVQPIGPVRTVTTEMQEAGKTLLRLIRNTIA